MISSVLMNSVRYREASAIKTSISIERVQLVPKNGVRYREVSAIKLVRYREVPLYIYLKHINRYKIELS